MFFYLYSSIFIHAFILPLIIPSSSIHSPVLLLIFINSHSCFHFSSCHSFYFHSFLCSYTYSHQFSFMLSFFVFSFLLLPFILMFFYLYSSFLIHSFILPLFIPSTSIHSPVLLLIFINFHSCFHSSSCHSFYIHSFLCSSTYIHQFSFMFSFFLLSFLLLPSFFSSFFLKFFPFLFFHSSIFISST